MKANVDWTELRDKIAQGMEAVSGSLTIDGVRLNDLLLARAKQLAVDPAAVQRRSDGAAALVMRAGAECYALELRHLAGLVPFHACSAVPGGPTELRGLVNARGDIWAAFDLCRLINPSYVDNSDGGYSILMRHERRRIALRVDDVERVCNLDRSKVTTMDGAISGPPVELIDTITPTSLIFLRPDFIWNHPAIREAT